MILFSSFPAYITFSIKFIFLYSFREGIQMAHIISTDELIMIPTII